MNKFLFVILILFSFSAWACEVYLPQQLLVFNDGPGGKSIYNSKDCGAEVIDELHQQISALEGRVAAYQLKELVEAKGHKIQIGPQAIQIKQFRTLIREQLPLPAGIHVKATRPVNMPAILGLPGGDKLEISCSACLYGIHQPINVTILGFDGTRRSFHATADFAKMVRAYRLLAPLPSFSELSKEQLLKEEYVEAIPHTDLVTDVESLKFYKTNKPLKTGDLLRKSDLNALNLVKAGLRTEVILENSAVRIKTQGISRSNGSIGELVEVFHPQKNKKYQGKVVDINKVLVEL